MNRGDLRNSHTRNHASRADRTRSNTDLHSVDTRIDQSLSAFGRCDVAANDLNAIKSRVRLDLADHLQCQSCAAVCGVNAQGKATALILDKDDVVQLREIEASKAIGDQWVVTSGLMRYSFRPMVGRWIKSCLRPVWCIRPK